MESEREEIEAVIAIEKLNENFTDAHTLFLKYEKDAKVLAEVKEYLQLEITEWQSGSGSFHLGDPIWIDGIRSALNKIKELQGE